MKRTTISLPEDLAGALAREARRHDRSVSEIARDAIAAHLGLVADQPRTLGFAAVAGSGQQTVGRDMEELMAREWDEPARDR